MTRPVVVAIDGPAGVGKSTVARLLARRLGLSYVDTGAMYRAAGLEALGRSVDPDDAEAVKILAESIELELVPGEGGVASVRLDGAPVEDRIRTPEVGEMASKVARHPAVRRRLVQLQRAFGETHGAVMEGRDIGTVVFPDTPHKFFLEAEKEVRVHRRVTELEAAGRFEDARAAVTEIGVRDSRDRERSTSPLRADETYFLVDTTRLSIDEVVERLADVVRRRQAATWAVETDDR